MTAHRYAELLLAGPDLPLFVGGYGSDDGYDFPASSATPCSANLYSGDICEGLRIDYDEPEPRIHTPYVYGLPGNQLNDALARQSEDLSGNIYRKITADACFSKLPLP